MDTLIDFRSDTVTRPTPEMRKAMAQAPVGDDVFGDDPEVDRLQRMAAEMAGKEAALYLSSGTQSNLAALMSHCGRGDEYIVGEKAHTFLYEGGGAAVLGSIQPQTLPHEPDGSLNLERVAAAVKDPEDAHYARSRLLCLENTWWGRVMNADYPARAREVAQAHGLGMHLDGARVFNAVVAQNTDLATMVQHYDSVSICLSKGLGAPIGSILVGPRDFIKEAHRWRKMLGGGMRQVGILAAAGIYALTHHVDRLAEDHARAQRLGERLAGIGELNVTAVATNMVFVDMPGVDKRHFQAAMKEQGILVTDTAPLRLVTHLDVDDQAVETLVAAVGNYLTR